MFNVLFSGRLTKQPEPDGEGTWGASIIGEDGKAVRLYLRRQRLVKRLQELRKGSPLSGTGSLKVIPTINRNGEARAFIHIHVEDLITLETTNDR